MEQANTSSLKKTSKTIRYIAVAEGVSFILLLSLSIIKRIPSIDVLPFDVHLGIKYLGYAHGILFVLFIVAIALGIKILKWSYIKAAIAFIASICPFGTFVLDYYLIKEEKLMS
jgi:integral membrane protein